MSKSPRRPLVHDQVAPLYDKARPSYPAALFDDIVSYGPLPEQARLLEIGCGTGQATLPLAERGYAIDCVEPGARMAAIARAKLAGFPAVSVICADFERFSGRPASYDLLFSATAFHWVDPTIRFQKAHDLLKMGGALALFWHRPTQTGVSRDFEDALQAVYRRVAPELARGYKPAPRPDQVTTEYEALIPASGYFADLALRKHTVATEYSAGAYADLLGTFSDHRSLAPAKRTQLLSEIKHLINAKFAGTVVRETVALLYLARRE